MRRLICAMSCSCLTGAFGVADNRELAGTAARAGAGAGHGGGHPSDPFLSVLQRAHPRPVAVAVAGALADEAADDARELPYSQALRAVHHSCCSGATTVTQSPSRTSVSRKRRSDVRTRSIVGFETWMSSTKISRQRPSEGARRRAPVRRGARRASPGGPRARSPARRTRRSAGGPPPRPRSPRARGPSPAGRPCRARSRRGARGRRPRRRPAAAGPGAVSLPATDGGARAGERGRRGRRAEDDPSRMPIADPKPRAASMSRPAGETGPRFLGTRRSAVRRPSE